MNDLIIDNDEQLRIQDIPLYEIARVCTKYIDIVTNGSNRGVRDTALALGIEQEQVNRIIRSKVGKEQLEKYSELLLEVSALDKARILEEAKNKAFFNIKDIADFDGKNLTFKAWKELPNAATAAIKEVKRIITIDEAGQEKETVVLKTHDSLQGLKMLIDLIKLGDQLYNKNKSEIPEGQRLFDNIGDAVDAEFTEVDNSNDSAPIERKTFENKYDPVQDKELEDI